MIGTIINALAILAGGTIGLIFKSKISKRFLDIIMLALPLAISVVGVSSAIATKDMLGMILCLVVGSIIGEAAGIEKGLNNLGDSLQKRVAKNGSGTGFTDAFVGSSLLFCVGSMAIMGSLNAGMAHNYDILLSKSLLDGISAISFAATMGYGVLFSAIPVLFYQGAITLLANVVAPILPAEVIAEMSAVGGVLIIALSINMLNLREKKIPTGNMLPAILLPILYQPFVQWISTLFQG
ncbi:MAG: DUF554 domain-containing protein [Christensenellales bacterium]|jgi:uncharacterized membrane protein YqgA involved in biofilm formation